MNFVLGNFVSGNFVSYFMFTITMFQSINIHEQKNPYLDAVPKAVTMTCPIFRKYLNGSSRVQTKNITDKVPNP